MNPANVTYIAKTFLMTLVISFLIDKLIFVTLNKISDKVYTGQKVGKLNQYLLQKDDFDFIVFGSSRANHNIDPKKISNKGFNMGIDGQKLAYSGTLIKLLQNKKEQTLLLHIDPENAFNEAYLGNDIKALLLKYNRNNIVKTEIDNLKQNNILQKYYWSLSYNGSVIAILKNYFKPNYDYRSYFGYDPIHVSETQREIFQNILQKNDTVLNCKYEFKLNKIYKDYIDELNTFCKANNKHLIIFTSPKFSDKCKNDNKALSQVLDTRNIPYFDLTDFFNNDNAVEYWKDKEHLSSKGAELFTEKIKGLFHENYALLRTKNTSLKDLRQ